MLPDDSIITADGLHDFVQEVIHQTARNRSSMLEDVVAGRPTEIDHLNGYVVMKGAELGIDCPANQELLQRVRSLTEQQLLVQQQRDAAAAAAAAAPT
jgi:2-dehydropantoate 2-reductase